eukprot:scpid22617/ scgid7156/ 
MLARNNLREVSTGMWLCVVLLVGTLSPTASAVTTASTSTATTVSAAGTDNAQTAATIDPLDIQTETGQVTVDQAQTDMGPILAGDPEASAPTESATATESKVNTTTTAFEPTEKPGNSTTDSNMVMIGNKPTSASGLVCPTFGNAEVGFCPITNESCSSDATCGEGRICCRKGCGGECVVGCLPQDTCEQTCLSGFALDRFNCTTCSCKATPAPPVDSSHASYHKPRNGTCPEFQATIGLCTTDMVVERCVYDTYCPGQSKCCRSGCGRSCTSPCYEPDCSVPCKFGYKAGSDNCATCECREDASTMQNQVTSYPAITTNATGELATATTTAGQDIASPNRTDDLIGRHVKMELEIHGTNPDGDVDVAQLLSEAPDIKESLRQQLQSQLGLFPGQLQVTKVRAAATADHLLVSMILMEYNGTSTAIVDEKINLIGQRTRDGQLWLTHEDKKTNSFYRLRSVGILSIGKGNPTTHKRRQVVAIVVAVIGLVVLVLILSIIAFVNWRADRRKKLLLSGTQRHSTAVQYDNTEGTTFINPFGPQTVPIPGAK